MENSEFQDLVMAQFEKMNKRFDKIDDELSAIKNKQREHDTRFDGIDRNVDIIAKWTKQLLDNENELADLFGRRKSRNVGM